MFTKTKILGLAVLLGSLTLFSCSQDEDIAYENEAVKTIEPVDITVTELAEYDYAALKQMEDNLIEQGIDIPANMSIDNQASDMKTRGAIHEDLCVRVFKVSSKIPHPSGNGSLIDNSGVVIVPKKVDLFSDYRIGLCFLESFLINNMAPSVNYQKPIPCLLTSAHVYAIQATKGYAVIIPDYPGYGDSMGQCTMPVLGQKQMALAAIAFTKAAQKVLSDEGYKCKSEIVISGYSLGGFAAASMSREIEMNPGHGLNAKLMVLGGVPYDPKYLVDKGLKDITTSTHIPVPWMLNAYKQNDHPEIDLSAIFKKPYDTKVTVAFNGNYDQLQLPFMFPLLTKDLYTENFRKNFNTDPSFAYLHTILNDNKIQPWKNKGKLVVIQGTSDKNSYYEPAVEFAKGVKNLGGEVTFIPLLLTDHGKGNTKFYVWNAANMTLAR